MAVPPMPPTDTKSNAWHPVAAPGEWKELKSSSGEFEKLQRPLPASAFALEASLL